MSWLTFVLLALVLIFAVQGFRKGMLRMAISMVFFLMVLGVTSWLNPYISDFVRACPPPSLIKRPASWKAASVPRWRMAASLPTPAPTCITCAPSMAA